jgi:hypothetical protein
MTTWWNRLLGWLWPTWAGDEEESVKGNRPETLEWRRKRRELIAAAKVAEGKSPKRRRTDLYDPYPDSQKRPRMRCVVIGGPFLQTVNMGGWSAEDYPFEAKGADRQLADAVELATIIVNAKLTKHEEAKAARAKERERLRAERAYERAVEREAIDKRKAAKEHHEP